MAAGDAARVLEPSAVSAPAALPAVQVDNVSVSYRIRLESRSIIEGLLTLVSRRQVRERLVPAVRDVSFTVPQGSVLGIIGRNGAGKSTLLRLLAGTLPPEAGRIVVRGRVSLLAVGLGMSEALTGRENIRLGGLAIGLPPSRLDDLIDEIAEFAQLGEYVDFPIRTYSAGMRARLAVAIAAHLDPEVLLIDEALTGGDSAFQEHVAEKLAQLTGQGRTVIIVTHGLSTVRTMATQALWMHEGRVAEAGDPDEVVNKYLRYCRLESLWEDV
jgi:ABC-2 type transport system ATP-binding protein/teichoic acid transport system ATP-binding protein